MAQFNLISAGTIRSNTTSGTGNRTLSNEEIFALCDGNITSSGATVSGTDSLYIDVDLGFRVQIDNINLFMDVPGDRASALTNVDFYYKNLETDSYTICAKNYDIDKFYASGFPTLFAPQYIRIVIDNQAASIYEIEALNDDTQVSFGESGNETLLILNHITGGYNELGIFNNSSIGSKAVNAYVVVDYSGEESDYYIKLSNNIDGPFYGFEDGADLKNNDFTQTYTWNMGAFDNGIVVDSNTNLINSSILVGYYTSPVLDISDKFNNTFLMTDTTIVSGTNITSQIRHSDLEPLPFNKLFWLWKDSLTNTAYIYVGDMTSGYEDSSYYSMWNSDASLPISVKFDRNNGDILVIHNNSSNQYRVRRYDYLSKTSYYSSYSNLNNVSHNWDVDSDGCVWGYVKQDGFRIVRFNYNFSERTTIKENSSSDFLGDLSATKTYPTCWYVDNKQNLLEHVNSNGESIVSIVVSNPTCVTALPDGGCWVVSVGDSKLIQYSYYGTEQRFIVYSSTTVVNKLKFGAHSSLHPFNDLCLWLLLDAQRVVQIDFEGNTLSETYISNASNIEPFSGGCLVYCESIDKTYQLDENGAIKYTWDFHSYTNGVGQPYPATIYYDEFVTMENINNLLPLTNDPYWATDLGWIDMPLIGYKLPLFKYHQTKFKFIPIVEQVTLINPDAEYGDSTGWYNELENCSVTTSNVYEGTYSFITGADVGGTDYHIACYNRVNLDDISIDLISNKTIFYAKGYISGFSSTTGYAPQILGIGLRFRDNTEAGPAVISTTYSDALTASSEGTYYLNTITTVLPPNAQYIEVFIWYIYRTTYNYIQFDAVELYAFNSPELKSVVIPKPVIINDIQPQEFKNIYIKKEIPADAAYKEYETKLKCWWGNEEE